MATMFWSGIEVCRMVVGIAPRKFTFMPFSNSQKEENLFSSLILAVFF
uniref:Uncharacterized protein n=1 Tax=Anguilla anguilla TaxID=7936 RepID=A0A0E9S2D2_ANGAN